MGIDGSEGEAKPGPMEEGTEQHLFKVPQGPQSVQKASKRQWSLLEAVLVEQQAAGDPRLQGNGKTSSSYSKQQAHRAPPAESPGGSQYMYVLGVLGLIFGVCALL